MGADTPRVRVWRAMLGAFNPMRLPPGVAGPLGRPPTDPAAEGGEPSAPPTAPDDPAGGPGQHDTGPAG
jgi:hypothetical protein